MLATAADEYTIVSIPNPRPGAGFTHADVPYVHYDGNLLPAGHSPRHLKSPSSGFDNALHALATAATPLGVTLRGLFRHRTLTTVELTDCGNFVVDIPVPEKVRRKCGTNLDNFYEDDGTEFTHVRYTAVTGDPDEFASHGYTLRPAELNRETELFIVITMYNENDHLFIKTWKAVLRNIAYLCHKRGSPKWGPGSWRKVVVCIVADGRMKIHRRTLLILGVMGVYQEGMIKTSVNTKEVTAHLFEYTTQIMVDSDMTIKSSSAGIVPVQVIFCLKERNAKKINSHRWFFNAFGKVLSPKVCVLLDVGTKPSSKSIYHLWKAFDKNPQVGGACGEIYVEVGAGGCKLINPLVAAQNFEYKISNILDKPFESCFGFISVLPGAFSAYRYQALQNDECGNGPLHKYFMGESMHGGANVSKANMYLAEDRILAFELVTKRRQAWVLKYVRRARAETDVPDTIQEFISQRRRWLNGSFFAGVHSIANFYQILFRSGHSFGRKLALLLETLYNFVSLIFSWFSLGNMYLTFCKERFESLFYFLCGGAVIGSDPFGGYGHNVFLVMRLLYLLAIVLVFVASLGNRPQGSRALYLGCFFLFALIMASMLYVIAFTLFSTLQGQDWSHVDDILSSPTIYTIFLSLAATYGIYLFASIIHLKPWHMVTSFIQYMLFMPSFVNILMVYAFCNLHDVSWGTKGETKPAQDVAPIHTKPSQQGNPIVVTDLPTQQTDIDAIYEHFLNELPPKHADSPDRQQQQQQQQRELRQQQQEDFFRLFRTRIVLLWMLSNAVLIVVMTTRDIADQLLGVSLENPRNPYLTVLLWSVTGLSFVRFLGSMLFLALPL
ncbi:chitin synthase-domain-containing protein [Zopfochytrium polystomum]|nr:chitin synthase-domain-containing protein [Zopfochytrium polystomum]